MKNAANFEVTVLIIIIIFLNFGTSSRGGRQKLILEIIAKLLLLLNDEIKVA